MPLAEARSFLRRQQPPPVAPAQLPAVSPARPRARMGQGPGSAGAERSQIDFQPQPGRGVSKEVRLF